MEKTNYVREYIKYSRGSTPKQAEVRSTFSLLISVWKTMGLLMQSSWNGFSSGENMTGCNAFIWANVKKVIDGEPIELFKPIGEEPLTSVNAETGPAVGEVFVYNASGLCR